MNTHIAIMTDQGEQVWPIARVHIFKRPDEGQTMGLPTGCTLMNPEMHFYQITEEEYERVKKILTDPLVNPYGGQVT